MFMQQSVVSPDECALEALRILYLEDESLVAMNIVTVLEAAGAVVDDCTSMGEAFTALDQENYDLALLDVNIREKMSFPVAEAALAKGLPLVFVTGYGREVLPPEWRGHTVCEKPCTQADLCAAIHEAMDKRGIDPSSPQGTH
jgi:CheY-like chemotaxis protein